MQQVKFIFDADGKLYRESVERVEISLTTEIAKSLCSDMSIKVRSLIFDDAHGRGTVGTCVDADTTIWWTVYLPVIRIKTRWLIRNEKWVPDFNASDTPSTSMSWVAPANMAALFLVPIKYDPSRNVASKTGHAYLFAMNPTTGNQDTWRLPLGNLYDECRICMGRETFTAKSHLECLFKVLEQFECSEWNADLWTDRIKTQSLFAFIPNNEGFKQCPPPGDWTNHCTKVVNSVSEKLCL